MKAKDVRIVLAFYSSEEGHAERAFHALKRSEKACLIGPEQSSLPPLCNRYKALRLEGESLVAVETLASRIEAVLNTLRLEGSPAIFAVHPDVGTDTIEEGSTRPPDSHTGIQNRRSILARLQENNVALESARQCLMEATRLDHELTPAAEWILDNSHLIRTQVIEVKRHLPRDYSSRNESAKESGNVNELCW